MEIIDFLLRAIGIIGEAENEDEAQRLKSRRTFVIAVIAVTGAIILTLILYPILN